MTFSIFPHCLPKDVFFLVLDALPTRDLFACAQVAKPFEPLSRDYIIARLAKDHLQALLSLRFLPALRKSFLASVKSVTLNNRDLASDDEEVTANDTASCAQDLIGKVHGGVVLLKLQFSLSGCLLDVQADKPTSSHVQLYLPSMAIRWARHFSNTAPAPNRLFARCVGQTNNLKSEVEWRITPLQAGAWNKRALAVLDAMRLLIMGNPQCTPSNIVALWRDLKNQPETEVAPPVDSTPLFQFDENMATIITEDALPDDDTSSSASLSSATEGSYLLESLSSASPSNSSMVALEKLPVFEEIQEEDAFAVSYSVDDEWEMVLDAKQIAAFFTGEAAATL